MVGLKSVYLVLKMEEVVSFDGLKRLKPQMHISLGYDSG